MTTEFIGRPAQEVNTTTAGDQQGASVAMLSNGGHVVAWNSNGNVYAQVFDASGAKTGGELLVFTGRTCGGIAQVADGSLVVCGTRNWSDTNGPHSAADFTRLTLSGSVLVGPTVLDDSGNYDTWVSGGAVYAMADGGFAITDVHTTRPTPLQSVSESIRVFGANNAPTGAGIPGEGGFMQDTAQMKNGGFAVAGNTNQGPGPTSYMWRTEDSQGNTIASASFAGQYGVNDYQAGDVIALADGRALATWQFVTYGYKGVGNPVWQAQWIDASGHASGGVFTLGLDSPYNADFTALADGSFIATWTQQANYAGPVELYAQHFDGSAHADSGVLHLASLQATTSPSYTITATSDGGFLLETQRTGDGQDVWEQKFDHAVSGSSQSTHVDVNGGITPLGNGDYSVSGGAGLDQVAIASAHTGWSVTQSGGAATLTGPGGTDTLTGVERIRFSDGYAIALDVNGHAGEAYRLYQAAFDRAPDLSGLGFQMNDLDMGYSTVHVAQNFIDSPEFQRTYGPSLSNTDFITLLYRNVLDREPDSAGLQYHLNEFAQGDTRANMLTHFSESPENQANVIGTIANGMLFVPYA